MSEQPWDINEILAKRTGLDLVKLLSEEISGTELNSLLLAVFDRITGDSSVAELLQAYRRNRFVQPAGVDMLGLRASELETLRVLQSQGFEPVELSPVSVLGSCSVLGTVDQKKILSATRGTEVLADATNALAIHIAHLKQRERLSLYKFCTTHRHVRTPPPKVKGHTAHFVIACWVTGGRDEGSYGFERRSLAEHLRALRAVLLDVFGVPISSVRLYARTGYDDGGRLLSVLEEDLAKEFQLVIDNEPLPNDYYRGLQFKVYIRVGDNELEIADGGFTDWTQRLLQNKKERFLISGLGLEFLTKIT